MAARSTRTMCSHRVKKVMDEGNDKAVDAQGKSLDECLLLRKGVYPYDYVDGFENLQETELPTSKNSTIPSPVRE